MDAILAGVQWELLSLTPPGWGGNLLRGLLRTFEIALGAYVLGLAIGLGGALGKIYGGPVLRWTLEVYTTLIRAVPELVLILLLYYAGTDLLTSRLRRSASSGSTFRALRRAFTCWASSRAPMRPKSCVARCWRCRRGRWRRVPPSA